MRQIGLHTADRTSCNMNDEEDINENEHGDESRKENDDTADNEDASLEKVNSIIGGGLLNEPYRL